LFQDEHPQPAVVICPRATGRDQRADLSGVNSGVLWLASPVLQVGYPEKESSIRVQTVVAGDGEVAKLLWYMRLPPDGRQDGCLIAARGDAYLILK
jgi:hypothetical protein